MVQHGTSGYHDNLSRRRRVLEHVESRFAWQVHLL